MKNFLVLLGLLFLALLLVLGIYVVGAWLDGGRVVAPPPVQLIETPARLLTPGTPHFVVTHSGTAQWINPLDNLPTDPPPTRTPLPSPTPAPTVQPEVYRRTVMERLKRFASALQRWLDANKQVSQDSTLLQDAAWRNAAELTLDEINASALALAESGQAPFEYAAVAERLNKIRDEAQGLSENYLKALESGDSRYFLAASERFDRIKEHLTRLVEEMAAAGWPLE